MQNDMQGQMMMAQAMRGGGDQMAPAQGAPMPQQGGTPPMPPVEELIAMYEQMPPGDPNREKLGQLIQMIQSGPPQGMPQGAPQGMPPQGM